MENFSQFPSQLPSEEIDEATPKLKRSFKFQFHFPFKVLLAAIAVVAALAAMVGWSVFIRPIGTSAQNVVLAFDVPPQVTSGSATDFTITYENHESVALTNLSMDVIYPSGFRYIKSSITSRDGTGHAFDLAGISAGGMDKVVVTGIFSGSPDEVQQVQASLSYQRTNASATFTARADAKVNLQAPDFNLRINGPSQVISSQRIQYTVSFQNISSQSLDRMQLRMSLPDGFKFTTSTRPTLDHQTWELGSVASGASMDVSINGVLTGLVGDVKTVKAELGYVDQNANFVLQNRGYFTSTIAPPPVAVVMTSDQPTATLAEGEHGSYMLSYQNNGVNGLNNVHLGVILDGDAIDFTTVQAAGGALVGRQVVWNPSGQPVLGLLSPGQKGSFRLSFSLKSNLAALHITNQSVNLTPFFSSDELPDPLLAAALTEKIRGEVRASTLVQYVSGPKPPVPGSVTVYKITLHIETGINDVNKIEWAGSLNLPSSVYLDGSATTLADQQFTYNPSSGRVFWSLPQMGAGKIQELNFSVQFNPTQDQGGSVPLFKSQTLEGIDAYTGDHLTSAVIPDILTTVGQ